jgi:hypothetical protein
MVMRMKYLALAALAICALACLNAGVASALVKHDFEAGGTEKPPNYILTGSAPGGPITWKWGSGASMGCSANALNGTVKTNPTQELELEPVYEKCSLNGLAATVDTSCKSVFTGETSSSGHGIVHIVCPSELPVRVTVNGCTIEVKNQTPEGGTHYTNTGTGSSSDVDFTVTTTNVLYSKAGALCSLISGLSGELTITGNYTMKAYEDIGGAEGSQISFTTTPTIS